MIGRIAFAVSAFIALLNLTFYCGLGLLEDDDDE
jgi:hypothetical protein